MRKTETIRVSVDSMLKAEVDAVLNELGLTTSDAIRLSYEQLALRRGLPFDVQLPDHETRQAIQELDEGKDLTRYDDFGTFNFAMMGK